MALHKPAHYAGAFGSGFCDKADIVFCDSANGVYWYGNALADVF